MTTVKSLPSNVILSPEERVFPDFSLSRLLNSVFDPIAGSSICILTDFEDPKTEMLNYHFLENDKLIFFSSLFYQLLEVPVEP